MMKRKWAGSEARRQGGVDVAALPPAHYGSSTVHSGSMFSVHWGSDSHSTYTPSLAHTHYTSGEEGTDHWVSGHTPILIILISISTVFLFSLQDGSRKHYMRKKMSFSGELTMVSHWVWSVGVVVGVVSRCGSVGILSYYAYCF